MRALLTQPPGGWESTTLAEVPEPTPEPGEVVVEMRAVSLNPADAFQVVGKYPGQPKPPFVIGRDGVGVVVVGDRAGRWKSGDRVVAIQSTSRQLIRGTFAERQALPADSLAPMPEGWSWEEGAAAPLVMQTSWRALVTLGSGAAGDCLVITGASGGVGCAGVQLGLALGMTVIALSRSPDKRAALERLGVQVTLDPADPDLKKKIQQATEPRGADLVLETVGGDSLGQAVHWLGKGGRVMAVGVLAGVTAPVPIPSLMFKEGSVRGLVVSEFAPDDARRAWDGIVSALNRTGSKPTLDSAWRFSEYPQAFERLANSPLGKVVLTFP
jgi:NADPH2:quinone reductase